MSTIIRGSLCVLRPFRESDIKALVEIANDPLVYRWMPLQVPFTNADAVSWIGQTVLEDPVDHFVVEVDGQLGGTAGLEPSYLHRAGVAAFGYWLGRRYWGKGIATEAAALLSDYAFAARGLRRLEATVWAPNLASARVLEKIGFVREAVMRQGVVDREGNVLDYLLYAKVAVPP